jgi:hypothetical protein
MPRLHIAVEYVDGKKEVVSVGRPADLIAFADEFEKLAPDGPYMVREASWLVHRALKIERPFSEWIDELEALEVVSTDELTSTAEPEPELAEPASDPTPPAAAKTAELVTGEWPRQRVGRRISETPIASSSHA